MAEDDSSPEKIKQLEERLSYLETVARETVARLYGIERHLGLVFRAVPRELEPQRPAPQPPAPAEPQKPAPPTRKAEPVAPIDRPASPTTPPPPQHPGGSGERRPPTTPSSYRPVLGVPPPEGPPPGVSGAGYKQPARVATPSPSLRTKQGPDLESRIGGSWFNRIGVFAIFLGVAFFLKYAVDREWIGPTGRVLIGAAIGVGFLIGGERLREKYASYAYGLTGGGIAILYATIWFASAKRYDLLAAPVAFGLMAAVTAGASLLAARYSALPIAILGLIGGFLTPILLSTGVDNEAGLFGYIAVLDLGVLALAYSKRWMSLNYLAFIATVLMFGAWMAEWYLPAKLWTTIVFLTVFFIIFALLSVLHNVVKRRATGWLDLAMVFSNALLYFGTSYELLDQHAEYRRLLGAFAVLVSAFYLGLGYLTYRRDREDKLLIFTFLGLGFLFSVLAVPIQFEQHWITMGWAIEGAVMTWIGLRANDRPSRYAALVVFFIALSHWALSDVRDFAYLAPNHFVPLLNRRALSCAVLIGAMAVSALFYRRYGKEAEERASIAGLLTLAANGLAIALLSIDANDFFEQRKALASGRELADSIRNTKALTLTALWTVYAAGALYVGVGRRLKLLRFLALALLSGAIVKVLFVDLYFYDAAWHQLLINQTFAAFALLIGSLAAGAWFYARRGDGDEGWDEEVSIAVPLLLAGANVLAIIGLTAEVWGHFARMKAGQIAIEIDRIENTKQFALSALWTVYGAVTMLVGIRRGSRAVRIGALLLLALTTVKVLAIDLSYYNAKWHTLVMNQTFAAFALLVYALAWTARSYTHSERVDVEERSALVPVLVACANVLALIGLSAEALGYYSGQIGAGVAALADLRLAQQLSLSLVWAVYGGAMLAVGIARGSKLLRVMALGLLGLTIFKVFLFDLSSLERLYRIISFIVLGAILLAVSFLYQRYRRKISDLIGDADQPATMSADSN